MGTRRRYRKKPHLFVTAVQLDLDTDGFVYRKWGDEQRCNRRDWLVNNDGDVYTVAEEVFQRTYRELSPGVYRKTTPVWVEVATESGFVATKDGQTACNIGDYIVSNREDGSDAYCIAADRFSTMYELDE